MAEFNSALQSGSSWVITHNLNSDSVVVDAIIDNCTGCGDYEKIDPVSITKNSDNQLTVAFSESRSGYVRVVA